MRFLSNGVKTFVPTTLNYSLKPIKEVPSWSNCNGEKIFELSNLLYCHSNLPTLDQTHMLHKLMMAYLQESFGATSPSTNRTGNHIICGRYVIIGTTSLLLCINWELIMVL